jgi:type VI protein secretion system component Hcp
MSDEIKKVENEAPKDDSVTALSEQALEQTVGGTHMVDKASPVLMQACATGTHLKEATTT